MATTIATWTTTTGFAFDKQNMYRLKADLRYQQLIIYAGKYDFVSTMKHLFYGAP